MMTLLWIHAVFTQSDPIVTLDAGTPITVAANEQRCGRYQTLRLADPRYFKDNKYKLTDEHGNCQCPPEHLCYTTHQLEDLTRMQHDGISGSTDIEKAIQDVKDQMKLIVGCPIVDAEHVNWKTSRAAYHWQARSAVCRAVSGSRRTSIISWRMVLAGVVMLLLAFLVLLAARRQTGQQYFLAQSVPTHLGAPPPTDRRVLPHQASGGAGPQARTQSEVRRSDRSRSESPRPGAGRNRSAQLHAGRGMRGWKPKSES